MWRSKDKLRKIGVLITEDSSARLAKMNQNLEREKSIQKSPKKEPNLMMKKSKSKQQSPKKTIRRF